MTSGRRQADIACASEIVENANGGEYPGNSCDDECDGIVNAKRGNHFINAEDEKNE